MIVNPLHNTSRQEQIVSAVSEKMNQFSCLRECMLCCCSQPSGLSWDGEVWLSRAQNVNLKPLTTMHAVGEGLQRRTKPVLVTNANYNLKY